MNNPYTPTEEAFLHDYFGIERPKRLRSLDIFKKTRKGVYVTKETGDETLRVPHAVARLLLARARLHPRLLFRLGRADGSPAQGLMETYHVVPVPGFDRHVVTASADSAHMHGIAEFAIGWFPAETGWREGSKAVLLSYWRGIGYDRDTRCPEYVFEEGGISREEAGRWVGEAWRGNPDSEPDKLDEKEGGKAVKSSGGVGAAGSISSGMRELPVDDPIYARGYFVGMNRSGREAADDGDDGDEPHAAAGEGEPFDAPGFLQQESIERSLRITLANERRNDRLSNKKKGR